MSALKLLKNTYYRSPGDFKVGAPDYMCYAPFQIWLPQLLRYGGVGRPASTARRTALLKELDPRSNPAERGWSPLWCLRAGHAGEPFSLPESEPQNVLEAVLLGVLDVGCCSQLSQPAVAFC